MFGGGPYLPLYIRGDRVTGKVLAKYSWNPITTQSGSFLCTAANSTPIRVVTKEVKYICETSLTLEHSMSVISPAAPGLTAGADRVPARDNSCRPGRARLALTVRFFIFLIQNKSKKNLIMHFELIKMFRSIQKPRQKSQR